MFSSISKWMHKPSPRQATALRDRVESSPPPAAEKVWWMDSAHELERGLEVTEMTDLPDDLFSPGAPR
jgi:hypothetical protein